MIVTRILKGFVKKILHFIKLYIGISVPVTMAGRIIKDNRDNFKCLIFYLFCLKLASYFVLTK